MYVTGRSFVHKNGFANFNFRLTDKIPVVFNSLPENDSHFTMQKIGKYGRNVNVITINKDNCMAFMIGKKLTFSNFIQFISSGLESLNENLRKDGFSYLSQES